MDERMQAMFAALIMEHIAMTTALVTGEVEFPDDLKMALTLQQVVFHEVGLCPCGEFPVHEMFNDAPVTMSILARNGIIPGDTPTDSDIDIPVPPKPDDFMLGLIGSFEDSSDDEIWGEIDPE